MQPRQTNPAGKDAPHSGTATDPAETVSPRPAGKGGGGLGFPIDFVLLWVDGTDPAWQADFRRWKAAVSTDAKEMDYWNDNGIWRYRDMGLLRYWFRAVDRFAPWVRTVYFVTCGQHPDWLDESCPKLRCISHSEFMPPEYLPTFNSRAIQYCLYRIPELAEHFVLFDDDTFLIRPVTPDYYYRDGNPVLAASLRPMRTSRDYNWIRTCHNDTYEINSHFDIPRQVWANRRKWFDFRALGAKRAISNFVYFLANGYLPVKSFGHLPMPHLKSTFADIWRTCPESAERTCRNRFRAHDQICPWLAAAWNLATGRFFPATLPPAGTLIDIRRSTVNTACDTIRSQKYPQICINDSVGTDAPAYCFFLLLQTLGTLLPDKSVFEKDSPPPSGPVPPPPPEA